MSSSVTVAPPFVPPVEGASESELAERAVAGDGGAFAALYDRHERATFNFCYRLTGSSEDAADATQEAFIAVLERLPRLDGRELNFGAYLMTTARHSCYRLMERQGRAEPTDQVPDTAPLVAAGGGGGLGLPDPGDPGQDPERAAMLKAQQEEIRAANARLPERQREVLALRELQELSYDEIAEMLEMNRNSVAQLISRARINLRDELRGSALAAIAVSSPDCERALPLIAMRQDGQLDDPGDADWLDAHLGGCDTCRASVEAMQEAGVSYRGWLPLVPFAWLRMETIAKASESVGADWSDLPPRAGDTTSRNGSSNGGSGHGQLPLDGPALALGGGERRPQPSWLARHDNTRRGGELVVLTVILLLTLVALVVGDGAGDAPLSPDRNFEPAAAGAPTEGSNQAPEGNGDKGGDAGEGAGAGGSAEQGAGTATSGSGNGSSGGSGGSGQQKGYDGGSKEKTSGGDGGERPQSGGGTPEGGSTPNTGTTPPATGGPAIPPSTGTPPTTEPPPVIPPREPPPRPAPPR